MEERLSRAGSVLLGLACLFGLIWALVSGIAALGGFLLRLDSDLAVALIAASATTLVSIATLTISKLYERRQGIQQDLRARRTPVYESIVNTLYRVMFASILNEEPMPEAELKRFFAQTTDQLTIWGSDTVLEEWGTFKTKVGDDPMQAIFMFEDFLFAIRRDLGHKNKNLKRGSILKLFVTDIEDHLPGGSNAS